MAGEAHTAGGRSAPSPPPSERVRLARLALGTSLEVEGVTRGHPGRSGLWLTAGGGDQTVGAVTAATGDGRFDVSLHLVAHPVPLHSLADELRRRVIAAAEVEGLGGRLRRVDVAFEDLDEPQTGDGSTGGAG